MKLSEKILDLRKQHGMSQEDLAERLGISRQAISWWESGTVLPDSANVLQLSKLFGVTTDYLLNDDYVCNNEPVKVQVSYGKIELGSHLPFAGGISSNVCLLSTDYWFVRRTNENMFVFYYSKYYRCFAVSNCI